MKTQEILLPATKKRKMESYSGLELWNLLNGEKQNF